ncbi:hypothetical protein ACTXOY_15220 [Corynebacterium variabile]|uniref:hypothetical protein n=1 Tax=Corynebacterium variabile TaxID=1727 RepID=UPI003BB60590
MDLEAENRRLRKELAESQRANEILKKASAFFAAELELPTQVVVDFIDDNRAQYGASHRSSGSCQTRPPASP